MTKKDFEDTIHDARVRLDDLERWQSERPIHLKARTRFATDKICDFIEAVEWIGEHDRLKLGEVRQPGINLNPPSLGQK